MKKYQEMTQEELRFEYDAVSAKYQQYCAQGLALDMSRGKPSDKQLELSMPMLDVLHGQHEMRAEGGVDIRNYGQLDGIPEVNAFSPSCSTLRRKISWSARTPA